MQAFSLSLLLSLCHFLSLSTTPSLSPISLSLSLYLSIFVSTHSPCPFTFSLRVCRLSVTMYSWGKILACINEIWQLIISCVLVYVCVCVHARMCGRACEHACERVYACACSCIRALCVYVCACVHERVVVV